MNAKMPPMFGTPDYYLLRIADVARLVANKESIDEWTRLVVGDTSNSSFAYKAFEAIRSAIEAEVVEERERWTRLLNQTADNHRDTHPQVMALLKFLAKCNPDDHLQPVLEPSDDPTLSPDVMIGGEG